MKKIVIMLIVMNVSFLSFCSEHPSFEQKTFCTTSRLILGNKICDEMEESLNNLDQSAQELRQMNERIKAMNERLKKTNDAIQETIKTVNNAQQ